MTREEARLAVRPAQVKRQRIKNWYGIVAYEADRVKLKNEREMVVTYSELPGSKELRVVDVSVWVDNRKESVSSVVQWFEALFGDSPVYISADCTLRAEHSQQDVTELRHDREIENWSKTVVSIESTTFDGWAGNRVDRMDAEQFGMFLNRFAVDQDFRASRIKLPLRVILRNPKVSRQQERWSKAQFQDRFTVPTASAELQAKGLNQSTLYLSESEVEVRQSRAAPKGDIVIYRFKLKKRKWFLIEFEHAVH